MEAMQRYVNDQEVNVDLCMSTVFSEFFAKYSCHRGDVVQVESLIWIVAIVHLDFESVEGGNFTEVGRPCAESLVAIEVDLEVFKLREFLLRLANRTSITTEL